MAVNSMLAHVAYLYCFICFCCVFACYASDIEARKSRRLAVLLRILAWCPVFVMAMSVSWCSVKSVTKSRWSQPWERNCGIYCGSPRSVSHWLTVDGARNTSYVQLCNYKENTNILVQIIKVQYVERNRFMRTLSEHEKVNSLCTSRYLQMQPD